MKKQGIAIAIISLLLLLVTVCFGASSDYGSDMPSDNNTSKTGQEGAEELVENAVNEISYTTPEGENGYLYIPEAVLRNPKGKVPMVLMMMCTGGEARDNARSCGWVEKAQEEM